MCTRGGDHVCHHGGPQRQLREHLRVLRLQDQDAEGNAYLLTLSASAEYAGI